MSCPTGGFLQSTETSSPSPDWCKLGLPVHQRLSSVSSSPRTGLLLNYLEPPHCLPGPVSAAQIVILDFVSTKRTIPYMPPQAHCPASWTSSVSTSSWEQSKHLCLEKFSYTGLFSAVDVSIKSDGLSLPTHPRWWCLSAHQFLFLCTGSKQSQNGWSFLPTGDQYIGMVICSSVTLAAPGPPPAGTFSSSSSTSQAFSTCCGLYSWGKRDSLGWIFS